MNLLRHFIPEKQNRKKANEWLRKKTKRKLKKGGKSTKYTGINYKREGQEITAKKEKKRIRKN